VVEREKDACLELVLSYRAVQSCGVGRRKATRNCTVEIVLRLPSSLTARRFYFIIIRPKRATADASVNMRRGWWRQQHAHGTTTPTAALSPEATNIRREASSNGFL
jgi:hypothetical protein